MAPPLEKDFDAFPPAVKRKVCDCAFDFDFDCGFEFGFKFGFRILSIGEVMMTMMMMAG